MLTRWTGRVNKRRDRPHEAMQPFASQTGIVILRTYPKTISRFGASVRFISRFGARLRFISRFGASVRFISRFGASLRFFWVFG